MGQDAQAARCIIAAAVAWCTAGPKNRKRLERHSVLISEERDTIRTTSEATLKFRDGTGRLRVDPAAALYANEGQVFLRSEPLTADLLVRNSASGTLIILIEKVQSVARIWCHLLEEGYFEKWDKESPELRLTAYGLPPTEAIVVDYAPFVSAIVERVAERDRELVAPQADKFLRAPPILVPLVSHVAALSAEENLKFPVQLKRLADHFRELLHDGDSATRIEAITRNHLETWAEAQGKRYAFLDGGVARVLGLPGGEPTAMRVGIYCVRAGDFSLESRESWNLVPFVIGDIVDRENSPPVPEGCTTDMRRLAEAARYTLESLTGLGYVDRQPEVRALFMHGPLINQFTMYDEGEPNFLPYLDLRFLSEWNITERAVVEAVPGIPLAPGGGKMWRQFMAVYGFVARRLYEHSVPIVGVVERSAGRWLAEAVLDAAIEGRLIKDSYKRKVLDLLRKYNISDDFLFGCVLNDGEYLTPSTIAKNNPRRARERWHDVVGQYPHPKATVLKTAGTSFPFRIELNAAAAVDYRKVVGLIYHTARLLPRYAFPVGLDIVDRYAKVPDWLSKGVSARLGAAVLERAVDQGDPRLVAQLRQFLAHTPRDFFYRPR